MTVPGVPPEYRIFISYRRDDTAGYARSVYDELATHFGKSRVFIDIDTIQPGDEFTEVVANALNDCDVLLALIGPDWLARRSWLRRTRLADPNDFVRQEIATAIERGIPIIPVLLRGGEMPDHKALPPILRKLPNWQAFELSDQRWSSDMSVLKRRIESCGAIKRRRVPVPDPTPPDSGRRRAVVGVSLVVAAVLALAVALTLADRPDGGLTGQPPAVPNSSPPTSTPAAEGSATPNAPDGDAVFADGFSGAALDPDRWDVRSGTDHFQVQDGQLVLTTRPGDGVDYTTIEPTALPAPFTDVRFSVTIPPYHQAGQGGGALVLNPRGARPQLLTLGPGANGGVLVAPLICARAKCSLSRYEDFEQPDYDRIPDQQPDDVFSVQIRYVDGRLTYLLDGQWSG
jgi:hypothetical protein